MPNLISQLALNLPSNIYLIELTLNFMHNVGLMAYRRSSKQNKSFRFYLSATLSTLMAAYWSLFWIVLISHIGLGFFADHDLRVNRMVRFFEDEMRKGTALTPAKSATNVGAFRSVNIFLAMNQMVFLFHGWTSRQKLERLMTGWKNLRQNLEQLRNPQTLHGIDSSEPIRYYLLVLGGLGVLSVFIVCTNCYILRFLQDYSHYLLELWFMITAVDLVFLVETLQDLLALLMFYELSSTFAKIRAHMVWHLENGKVLQDQVADWSELILETRAQADLLSDYTALPQMSILLESLLLGVLTLFLAANRALEAAPSFAVADISLGLFTLARIYYKTHIADQVSIQEESIAKLLAEHNLRCPTVMNSQLKDLADLLMMKPMRINFWNIVTFRKSLCLKVVGQVITYLIVLQQFYES